MSFKNATNLSIRVQPNSAENVNAFGLPGVDEKGFRAGEFVGSIDEGGYLNCKVLTIAPHGMGTHTESIRHIVADGPAICDIVPLAPFKVHLVTISPVLLGTTSESYSVGHAEDLVLSEGALGPLLSQSTEVEGLVVRTSVDANKLVTNYTGTNPPYFTTEAMRLISARFEHLLVDLPSVDREADDGLLLNHRAFWKVPTGSTSLSSINTSRRSITEMIYVPSQLEDGEYWCFIAVPNIDTDALPSRVLLWK